jgi:hypothetical protein
VAALAMPPDYAQLVSRDEASAHAGVPVAAGGLWFRAADGSSLLRSPRRSFSRAASASSAASIPS